MRGAHPSLIVLFALSAPACLPPLPEDKDTQAENTPPGAPVVRMLPVGTDTALAAVIETESVDPDGDTVTYAYTWTVDGAVRANLTGASVPPEETTRGQSWTVTVTPNDGTSVGTAGAASAEIVNTPSEVVSVTLTPDAPFVTEDVTAYAAFTDVDDDNAFLSYRWFVDGIEVQSGSSTVLPAGSCSKGQRISVEVVANDGFEDSEPFVSSDAVVLNTPPTSTGSRITPDPAYESSVLTCAGEGFADADADAEGWTYVWEIDGADVATGPTLDGVVFSKGDVVYCAATPDDGDDAGIGLRSDAVVISNTAPSVTSVELSSYAPVEGDTLSVTVASTDDDGDAVTYRYAWFVDGAAAGTGAALASDAFARGDAIVVVVTPNDGTDDGAAVSSATATVANTAPVATSASITPSTAYTDDTLSVSVASSDADGDAVAYTYAWYVDGTLAGTSATLSGATAFERDDTVVVVVTPDDGAATGSAVTSATLTVANTAPTAPLVVIEPSSATPGEALVCSIKTDATDADDDDVTYAFGWTVDGAAYSGATDGDLESTVDGSVVDEGEVWECTVTSDDGTDSGGTDVASVTVGSDCTDGAYVSLGSYGIEFATVCPRTFDVGCTPGQSGCASDESPVMPVTLTQAYYISQTEITQGQYEDVMGSDPSYFASAGNGFPVEQVSWHDAAAFANALSASEGLSECYTCSTSVTLPLVTGTPVTVTTCTVAMNPYACDGYRLPTEAEWEGAARCGEDVLYAGSTLLDAVGWYSSTSGGTTQKTGQLATNACGLYDMSGNVWEWVNDRYSASYYSASGRTDPAGPGSGSQVVLRGGGYDVAAAASRVSNREGADPTASASSAGFRVVRAVP